MNNAERAVRYAIGASPALANRDIVVFTQGSYRNRVNVRQDSDVDVGVLCTNTFFWEGGPAGTTLESLGYFPATYRYADFKREVGEALTSYFDGGAVTPGDKAFDVKANTYRVEADVAPFFAHKHFDVAGEFINGVAMLPNSGGRIINWPEQHYDNGVTKNDRTSRAFKAVVRILKTLRYKMMEDGIASADAVPSFLIECLVWNVPDDHFNYVLWSDVLQASLAFLFNNTLEFDKCREWGEVSDLKYLFWNGQPWTWQGANAFLSDCWDYVDFE